MIDPGKVESRVGEKRALPAAILDTGPIDGQGR